MNSKKLRDEHLEKNESNNPSNTKRLSRKYWTPEELERYEIFKEVQLQLRERLQLSLEEG